MTFGSEGQGNGNKEQTIPHVGNNFYFCAMTNQEFSDGAFAELRIKDTEFEECRFVNLDFTGADLSGLVFIDCRFTDCNLSNVPVRKTAFREVLFDGCKLMGVVWSDCQPFFAAPVFKGCQMQFNSFVQIKLPGIRFSHCDLSEADFTGADVSGSVFEHTVLTRTIFEQTDLRKCDLRSARHFTIDPGRNKLLKMKISPEGAPGLLGPLGVIVD